MPDSITAPANLLIAEIQELHKCATEFATECKSQGSLALQSAYKCGQLLNIAKESLTHGQWLPWLDANLPDLHERTARNYMALAKRKTLSDLTNNNLTSAYRSIGILPEPVPSESTTEHVEVSDTTWIGKLVQYYSTHDPLKLNDPFTRGLIKQRLEPIVRIYERL